METFNVEQDLFIDKYQLDKECLSNPTIYYKYMEAASDIDSVVTECKDKLKVVLGQAQIRIRQKCVDEGKKVTEALIDAMVNSDAEVIAVQDELRKNQETQIKLNAALKAMDVKKSSLDNLVKLYCAGYYSTVSNDSKLNDAKQTQIENEIKAGIQRRD